MLSDLSMVMLWWGIIFFFGLVALPIFRKLFHNFFDQGYLFSKVFGLAICSFLNWLLADLRLLPFSYQSIGLVLIFFTAFSVWQLKEKGEFASWLKSKFWIFLLEELMFLATLLFWSYIRGFQSDIEGLEKFMDFGFMNSILRSNYFPPADMWFAGKPINYYYFGHYVAAYLTKISGIEPAVTYNLMIATLFAFCFSLTFSIVANMVRTVYKSWRLTLAAGLIAALLVSLGANLHPAYYNFKFQVLKKAYCDGGFSYWYPNATRYIGYCPDVDDKTIHEFPSYSFVVSDLHGHVSDIPFVLTFMAVCLAFMLEKQKGKRFIVIARNYSVFGLLLAISFMTNQWDYPIYAMVLGFVLIIKFSREEDNLVEVISRAVGLGLSWIVVSILLFLPFQLKFENMAKGVDFVNAHSLPHQILVLWGAPLFFGITFSLLIFFPFILDLVRKKQLNGLFKKVLFKPNETDWFALVLFVTATLLVIIPEIIFLKDIYIASYHRANTMFKLTYQSFIMYSILIGYVIIRAPRLLKRLPGVFLALIYLIFVSALLIYPFYSIKGYYGKIKPEYYKGLYGLNFLKNNYPEDFAAILWINRNIGGQPVLLEAVGDSYTTYERISMATGLPTVEGWLVHEWLWRGSFEEPGKRQQDVGMIYESGDVQVTRELLTKYQVKYVYVGGMEREKYPKINEDKIAGLGKVVFENGTTRIYELY